MGGGDPDENHLRTSAMVPPKSNCTLPLLPIRISIAPSLILTQDQKILLCGGYRNFQKCLGLNKDAWQEHSSLNEKRRYAAAVTMPGGVYMMGGLDSPTTWEWLPTGSDEWKRGNGIIPGGYGKYRGFYQGCGVKINDEEIALIGGVLTPRRLMKFNIKTEEFTSLGNVLKIKRENHACTVLSKSNELFLVCLHS